MQIPEQLASSEASIIKAQQQAHSLINSSVSQQSSHRFRLAFKSSYLGLLRSHTDTTIFLVDVEKLVLQFEDGGQSHDYNPSAD